MARKGTSPATICHKFLPVAVLAALLLASTSPQTRAQASSEASLGSGAPGSGGGGLLGAAAGAINGGIAGAKAGAQADTDGSGSSAQVSGSVSSSGGSSSVGASATSSSGSGSSSAAASASVSITTTPKPEGLLSKMKEIVKSSVESLTHDDKKDNSMAVSGTATQSGGNLGSGSQSGASVHVSANSGGLMSKAKDSAKDMKEEVKSMFKSDTEKGSSDSATASGSIKMGSTSASAKVHIGGGSDKKENPMSKMVHRLEEQAVDLGDRLGKVNENKSVAVELLDKSHETVKNPLEKALRPIDKVLGYEKDPLIQMYDASHENLRHPLAVVSKPVESVLQGAFKTSDEAKRDSERHLSDQQRREARLRDERIRKDGRSILGEITDKSVELYEKPIEIVLRPVDRLLGFDKKGKKNPLIQLIDEVYGLSKKPIDALARPFENILRKMAEGDQAYQVSVRFNADSNDPKLITRLADGALNIADRVITRPIEFAMRPIVGRKNSIVDATHSLKNATKLGIELFTKPIDRIIKEIAELGAIKDDAERETQMEQKRQEASRLVHALDMLHDFAQTPWEIVLRPVGKALGYNKEGKKEPLLRAWDVVHQVFRTPIQVVSKPLEDAILGESKRSQSELKTKTKVDVRAGQNKSSGKKNLFTDGIRRVEKFASRPIDVLTSPIRRLILGEDTKGPKVTAKAQVGGTQAKASVGTSEGPDKIVKTIEHMNNLALKPFEVITQPISDILVSEDKDKQNKKLDVKVRGSVSNQGHSQMHAQIQGSGQSSASAQVKTG